MVRYNSISKFYHCTPGLFESLKYTKARLVSLCHITSHHITSHHITSHHITSHHITSHHITSHHITSHHITSHHITSHHITAQHSTYKTTVPHPYHTSHPTTPDYIPTPYPHTCFNKIGSNAGSSSSPTFSNKHGFPNLTAFSRLRKKSLSVSLITSTPLSFSCKTKQQNQQHFKTLCSTVFIHRIFSGSIHTTCQ